MARFGDNTLWSLSRRLFGWSGAAKLPPRRQRHPNGKSLYSARVQSSEGRMEFPIAMQDEGTAARNEVAVLRSALRFAEELAESVRLRLGS